jgi:hypothetical protein
MDDPKHRTIHSADHSATQRPAADHRTDPHHVEDRAAAGRTGQRLSRILHDEKGNAVFLWEPVPPAAAGAAITTASSPEDETPVPVLAALDTGDLALETDELYDGDSHNPYMHDHETLHKHSPTPARAGQHERAAWIEMVHGIEAAKKRRGG